MLDELKRQDEIIETNFCDLLAGRKKFSCFRTDVIAVLADSAAGCCNGLRATGDCAEEAAEISDKCAPVFRAD